MIVAVIAGRWG
jgi:hypothetical protein